jgi:hypothetical protein
MIPPELAQKPDAAALLEWDPRAVVDGKYERGELTLIIAAERIQPVCEFLKAHRDYCFLCDVTASFRASLRGRLPPALPRAQRALAPEVPLAGRPRRDCLRNSRVGRRRLV